MSSRHPQKTEILFGIHPVQEAFRAGRRRIFNLYLTPTAHASRFDKIIQAAETRQIPVETVTPPQLAKLCGQSRHQGIGARVSPFAWTALEEVLARAPHLGDHHLILALDGLTDPHNLGALLRTALCTGVDGVLLPRRQSCGPTPTVAKISAGALEHTALLPVTNLVRTIQHLQTQGFWSAGLDRSGPQALYATDLKVPLILVIGGEGKGIRPLVRNHCDLRMAIPQVGPLDSLNASVAGAVAMYEILRQRQGGQSP